MLLGYPSGPSIRNLLLPCVFDASIVAFNKLTVNCAGIMTELCMLSRMNVAMGCLAGRFLHVRDPQLTNAENRDLGPSERTESLFQHRSHL